MKVAGFTFVKNAIRYDYPVAEAITSVLPLCDVFFVAVGDSKDETRELIRNLAPDKIRIVDTVWDSSLTMGGAVYASETNKAFDAIPPGYDWCIYIQADEVIHEKYLPVIRQSMLKHLKNRDVEGLLFRYRHFYGTFDYVAASRKWYRSEVRVIRTDKSIRSYRDAQGFRRNGRKLAVVPVDAEVYHYGWVRPPGQMQLKIDGVKEYYDGPASRVNAENMSRPVFDYGEKYDVLERFTGSHPSVMQDRINRLNWKVDVDLHKIRLKFRYRLLHWLEKKTGIRLFEFRNYVVVEIAAQRRF
jgi:hypothetical protein